MKNRETEKALRGEKPVLTGILERLHNDLNGGWRDSPEVRIENYPTEKDSRLSDVEDYNKRRNGWFAAVFGALELLEMEMSERSEVSAEDIEAIKKTKTAALELIEKVRPILSQKTPPGTEKALEELITEGEELLEEGYDLADKYHL